MRALPTPTIFRWTFNNSFEANEVPKHKFTSDGTLSKLNYRAESEKDFGVVHCWAENMLGQSSSPCVFTLIPAGENLTAIITFVTDMITIIGPLINVMYRKNWLL